MMMALLTRPTPFLFMFLLLLAACSGKQDDAPRRQSANREPARAAHTAGQAPVASDDRLMRAVFGQRYDARRGAALAPLAGSDERFVITPVATKVLPGGRAILVANADTADGQGEAMGTHAVPGLLNIYVLQNENGHWQVRARHENLDELGSGGSIGSTSWVSPGNGKTALAVVHGGTWQGHASRALSLYDVTGGQVRALTENPIDIHSDNNGACESAVRCWDVTGEWTFASADPAHEYDDLLLSFAGEEMPATDAPEAPSAADDQRAASEIEAHARYRFNGKDYVLVEGENPIARF